MFRRSDALLLTAKRRRGATSETCRNVPTNTPASLVIIVSCSTASSDSSGALGQLLVQAMLLGYLRYNAGADSVSPVSVRRSHAEESGVAAVLSSSKFVAVVVVVAVAVAVVVAAAAAAAAACVEMHDFIGRLLQRQRNLGPLLRPLGTNG